MHLPNRQVLIGWPLEQVHTLYIQDFTGLHWSVQLRPAQPSPDPAAVISQTSLVTSQTLLPTPVAEQ